jgi:hypothetical protein
VQIKRRPLQSRQRLTAEKTPAEDVVLALPGCQRLVGRQIELPVHVLGPRGQQPLARQARLGRPDRAQAGLAATEAFDAKPGLGIFVGNQLEPLVAIAHRSVRRFLGLGDLLSTQAASPVASLYSRRACSRL